MRLLTYRRITSIFFNTLVRNTWLRTYLAFRILFQPLFYVVTRFHAAIIANLCELVWFVCTWSGHRCFMLAYYGLWQGLKMKIESANCLLKSDKLHGVLIRKLNGVLSMRGIVKWSWSWQQIEAYLEVCLWIWWLSILLLRWWGRGGRGPHHESSNRYEFVSPCKFTLFSSFSRDSVSRSLTWHRNFFSRASCLAPCLPITQTLVMWRVSNYVRWKWQIISTPKTKRRDECI